MNFRGFKISLNHKLLLAIAACAIYVSYDNIISNDVNDGRFLRVYDDPNNVANQEDKKRELQAASPVITAFISGSTNMEELCHSMRSLRNVRGNSNAPVMTFHASEPDEDMKEFLRGCTTRNVFFSTIDLDFPEGFVPEEGKDYTNAQINRFWTTKIWDLEDLAPYDVIMRIDHDTCFSTALANVPGFASIYHVYSSQFFPGTYELNVHRLRDMFEFTRDYIKANNIQPGYPKLWQMVLNTEVEVGSIPNFQDTFEISKKSFMQSPAVAAFHGNLTEAEPYGFFTHGWNVDAARFLTAALFGTPNSVDILPLDGFVAKELQSDRVHPGICHFDKL